MSQPLLSQLNLVTSDMESTLTFYRLLGLDIPGRVNVIGFTLDTRAAVDATYAQLVAAAHDGLQPPFDTFWGARYAIVEDPNGNHVGLMSPIDPAQRSAGPEL
jgi:predicted enzyme related to lactoylglutathione lyase